MLIVLVDQFCAVDFPDGHLLRAQYCKEMQMEFKQTFSMSTNPYAIVRIMSKKAVRSHRKRGRVGENQRKREGETEAP